MVSTERENTLLGVINGVQVEVSGVGGDAIDQLDIPSSRVTSRGTRGTRRKNEGSRKREKETHERILKVLVCPKPPFHP